MDTIQWIGLLTVALMLGIVIGAMVGGMIQSNHN